MAVGIVVEQAELAGLNTRLAQLTQVDLTPLLNALGLEVESQTRTRIESEKTSPDGTPWKPNARGGPILELQGLLHNSITYQVAGDQVQIGTNLRYARIHQFGGEIRPRNASHLRFQVNGQWVTVDKVEIPARPFLGLSQQNWADVALLIDDFVDGLISG